MESKPVIYITPETIVRDLLLAYPDLEEALIKMSPAFQELKNPVLKEAILRVTNLQKLAQMAEMAVSKLINDLRLMAGQDKPPAKDKDQESDSCPAWVYEKQPVHELDARVLIASGGHPLQQVIQETNALQPGEVYLLITPFFPAPLVERLENIGFESYSKEEDNKLFKTYFLKK